MPTKLNPNSFKALLSQNLEYSFSPVIVQLIQKTVQEDVDIDEIAKLISMDPMLAASVIGIANTPHYSSGKSVTSIERAIIVLGIREILKLAVGISIKKNLTSKVDRSLDIITMDWRMTIWSAVAAEHLAAYQGNVPKGQAYLACVLKDIPLILMNNVTLLIGPERSLIDFMPPQFHDETKVWGITHPEMSEVLAEIWNLPPQIATAMRMHHISPANLSQENPLTTAVVLGTRWSELIQGKNSSIEDMFNFELVLRSNLGMQDASEPEELRLNILKDFRDILVQLDITETTPDQRLYETSLSSLKNYYFLALDLADTAHDLPSIAEELNNHLSMFWQIPLWDIALKLPHSKNYMFFSSNEGVVSQFGPLPISDWHKKNGKKKSFPLTAKGNLLGELLIPKNLLMGEKLQAFTAYASFVNQSLANYYDSRLKTITQSTMLEELPIPVASISLDGELIQANQQFLNFMDLTEPESANIPKLLDNKFALNTYNDWSGIVSKSADKDVSILISDPNLSADQAPLYLATLRQTQEAPTQQLIMFIQSISEISDLETQVLKQRDFLQQLFASMQDIVLSIDTDGAITWTTPALQNMEGKNFFSISRSANTDMEWSNKLLQDPSNLFTPLEAGIKIENQRVGLFEFIISPLGGKSAGFLVVGRDLTNIRRLEAKIRQQAIRDGLTGLYNHSYFHYLLDSKIEKHDKKSSMIGLLFMDLDGFKLLNDNEGHIAGDSVLKSVGLILQENLRQGYDFAARYGGDEFAVLATNVTRGLLEKIANRLITRVNEETSGKVGLSVGIAVLEKNQDPSEFLHNADKALYTAKACGGKTFSWG